MPAISVVIPVYNSQKYLRECIDSVLAQSFADFEVVAVDDGSSDESPAILDEYAAKDSRVKVVHKANGGVSAARNDGFDVVSGDYVLFVDSDDYLAADALDRHHYWRPVFPCQQRQETGRSLSGNRQDGKDHHQRDHFRKQG